jgi:hypothetical protein
LFFQRRGVTRRPIPIKSKSMKKRGIVLPLPTIPKNRQKPEDRHRSDLRRVVPKWIPPFREERIFGK